MKLTLILIAIIITNHSYSQTEDSISEKILLEFREEVEPYLKEFAKNSISVEKNLDAKNLINARYHMFLAKRVTLEKKVYEIINKTPKYSNDKLFILKIVENQYRDTFIGLPQEFWKTVEQRVDKH